MTTLSLCILRSPEPLRPHDVLCNPFCKGPRGPKTATSPLSALHLHNMADSTNPALAEISSSDMEKLPIHTREGLAAPQPRWATAEQRQNRPPRNCLLRRILIALAFFAAYYLLLKRSYTREACDSSGCHAPNTSTDDYSTGSTEQTLALNKERLQGLNFNSLHLTEPHRIPLEAHIMSKCPDAQECLQDLILPTMEQVSDKVDFQLSFIAE